MMENLLKPLKHFVPFFHSLSLELEVEEEEEEIMMIMEEELEEEMSTTFLPQEIVMDILSRLPANSLVSSFKFVCKPWRNLIEDPDFIKMHLNRGGGGASINGDRSSNSSNNNNNHSLICKSGNELFQLYPPFNFEGILLPTEGAPKKLDFDLLPLSSRLVCSCNGLLCLSVNDDETIILINPSTRKYKVSPKQPIEFPPDLHKYGPATFGFGCCDEYKVIRIVFLCGLDDNLIYYSRYQFDIYSMSSNSWRRETRNGGYPYVISHQQSGVSVNGALHWVARYTLTRVISTDSWDTIISFDIKDEEFGLVPIPLSCHPTDDDDPYFNMHEVILMNMKGCLSMIRLSDVNNHIDIDLEIWVMKEYGIKESWTEEFVIRSSDSHPPRALSDFTICWCSNAYVLKGDQILIEGLVYTAYGTCWPPSVKLVLYDINERKIDGDFKRIGVPVPDEPCVDQVDYIETLVSLKSLPMSIEH